MGSSGINAVHGEKTEEEQHQLLYLGFSIHQEVASGPFWFLINSSWLLVFALLFFLYVLGLNLYCWKGIHFSWSLDFIFLALFSELIITLHFLFFFYFLLLKLCYLYPSFGHLFIHYLLQL